MATKVDSVISANSEKMPMFTYLGLLGVVLSLATTFMSAGTMKGLLTVASYLANGVAMYYVYDSLKKGMMNLEQPCTSLSTFCGYGVLAYNALMSIALLIAIVSSDWASTGVVGVLGVLVGFVYFILYIILGCKLMSNYEGTLKTLGICFVAIPAILIVSSIVGVRAAGIGGTSSLTTVIAILSAACAAFQFLVAHKVITGKNLF